jgi:LPS-assembly protein
MALLAVLAPAIAGDMALAADTPVATPTLSNSQKSFPESGEVLMQSDQLLYDKEKLIVTAQGNVEIAYGPRVVFADKVIYDQNTGVVTAIGNVALLDEDGNVAFAENVVLRNEMKDGVATTLSMLMTDNSKMIGRDAVRSNGNLTTLHRGVYSPCELCKEDPREAPLWQIKAFRVIHNKEKQRIIYEDAFMEFYGIPILYTPFFAHPDPTVKRQSGFLMPSIGSSTELGQQLELPYYWVIQPNMDATFSPRYTTKESVIFNGEFRHRLESGTYQFNGSGTWPETKTPGTPADEAFRGSLFGSGKFNLTPEWTTGFNMELASDDTYLRKYGLSDENDLTNNIFLRRIDGRNFFTADAYYFRGLLSTDDPDTTPWVAPVLDYGYFFPEQVMGGRLSLGANALVLGRVQGPDSRRLSTDLNWEMPRTLPSGLVYRLYANVRADIYATNDVPDPVTPNVVYGKETIVQGLPTIGMEWRYPMIKPLGSWRQVLEPIVQFIYAPNIGNSTRIPNEDSVSFEFDDTNLFSDNRFPGLDRWESGARMNAGVRYALYGPKGAQASVLFGQSFRFNENPTVSDATGLRNRRSDYVGQITLAPSSKLYVVHRFRLDERNYTFRRNELDVLNIWGPVTAQVGYAYYAKDQSVSGAGAREEVVLGSTLRLSEYWRLFGSTRRDLALAQNLANQVGITYEDECFGFTFGFYQNFVRDRDIEPSNTFLVQFTFKNLGSAGFGGLQAHNLMATK